MSSAHAQLFAKQGFLKLRSGLTMEDVNAVATLVDRAFDKPDLAARRRYDMGGVSKARNIGVVHQPSNDEPALRMTALYERCRAVAADLLGREAHYVYDYSIYKWPNNGHPTPWHQDQAYRGHGEDTQALHFWIPLQAVNEANGCMGFLPGSQKRGLLPHHRWDHDDEANALEAENVDPAGAVMVAMDAGDILVFHPLALHFSSPNQGESLRRTWIVHFGPHARIDPKTRLPIPD